MRAHINRRTSLQFGSLILLLAGTDIMLPIPDPCGKFGKLFSMGVGMANSFEAETLVHTRVLTDQGRGSA